MLFNQMPLAIKILVNQRTSYDFWNRMSAHGESPSYGDFWARTLLHVGTKAAPYLWGNFVLAYKRAHDTFNPLQKIS